MSSSSPDCRQLGLSPGERGALTGFTYRAVAALAHLREAWCIADPTNRQAIEAAARALLAAHSLNTGGMPALCAKVLAAGLDDSVAVRLIDAVGLLRWVLHTQYPATREQ